MILVPVPRVPKLVPPPTCGRIAVELVGIEQGSTECRTPRLSAVTSTTSASMLDLCRGRYRASRRRRGCCCIRARGHDQQGVVRGIGLDRRPSGVNAPPPPLATEAVTCGEAAGAAEGVAVELTFNDAVGVKASVLAPPVVSPPPDSNARRVCATRSASAFFK